ncbi:conserved Plasmodium protein, unknown function [Plasmodium chabaudi adami]|uniref:Uncharacterized protein n=2 Tax=Plasmodium chabaudi TaxID=5825 RepID=A0A1C6YCE9_PLACU|nr:conserved Plasmodium protein, unknown function [Plasmodium chabaudi adami]SCM20993.1 conserved Plasmodium protein, unknown function [Plasmodium chabaudi chabaudi]
MENITSCSLSIEKRYDHLKSFSNNIGGLVLELKDLIKVHEILIYKEKLKTSEKDKIKKQQDDLLVLKQELEIIKKENVKMDEQLKYYKRIDGSINSQINNVSENIQKVKLNINMEQKKKMEMAKNINEIKNKYSKTLKQKQLVNEKSSHLVKNTIGKIELSKEVNKEKCKDVSKETRYKNTNQIFNATKAEDNNIKKNNEAVQMSKEVKI